MIVGRFVFTDVIVGMMEASITNKSCKPCTLPCVSTRVLTLPDAHASHIIAKDKFVAELQQFIRASK